MEDTITTQQLDGQRVNCTHSHNNPLCVCNTTDRERARRLGEFLDLLADAGWNDALLMPLDDEGKRPAITGQFALDDPRAHELLHTPEEAINAVQNGSLGFAIYAGRAEHGTEGLVFTDHDDVDLWPPNETPEAPLIRSGSGDGYHQPYRNGGTIQNAKGKGELAGAGEVRAKNWFVVTPGSLHPSGGIYHLVKVSAVPPLYAEDLAPELKPGTDSTELTKNGGPEPLDVDQIEALPENFEVGSVMNEWGYSLEEVRKVSHKLDRLLSSFNPGDGYDSTSEADMATVAMLLIWGFSEDDIADILRACRTRRKLQRDDYVYRTISRTALTKTIPLDPSLGRALMDSARDNGGRPVADEATLRKVKLTLQIMGGEATVAQLVGDDGLFRGDAKRKSKLKRVRRALKLLEQAGFVSQRTKGATFWRDERLDSLTFPHE